MERLQGFFINPHTIQFFRYIRSRITQQNAPPVWQNEASNSDSYQLKNCPLFNYCHLHKLRFITEKQWSLKRVAYCLYLNKKQLLLLKYQTVETRIMQLLLSLMAISAFCVVAAIIETIIGTTSSTQRLKPEQRNEKRYGKVQKD